MATIDQIRPKIERAKKHIRDLEAERDSFLRTKPYVVSTKRDAQTKRLIYYLAAVRQPPEILPVIAGDVLQNLRSALDHLAFQLVRAAGNTPSKQTYFPVADSAAKYESAKIAKVQDMAPKAVKAIDEVKPYKGGNETIWRLHKLNNVDKHRLLIAVGSAFHSFDFGAIARRDMERLLGAEIPAISLFMKPADRMFPLRQGVELFIDVPDAEANEKVQFRFDVAFGEPQVAEGEPLVETLQGMADAVDTLLSDFAPLLK